MARPEKPPEERRIKRIDIPVTVDERETIRSAAKSDGKKPITWARETLLRIARRRKTS